MATSDSIVLLLLEDDRDDVHFLKRAFARLDGPRSIQVIENGEEALAYLSGERPYSDRSAYPFPTHVLLDLKVPKKSGIEVLEWMKRDVRCSALPAAILSSSGQTADRERARALGVDGYWTKSSSFAGLITVAKEIVAWMHSSTG